MQATSNCQLPMSNNECEWYGSPSEDNALPLRCMDGRGTASPDGVRGAFTADPVSQSRSGDDDDETAVAAERKETMHAAFDVETKLAISPMASAPRRHCSVQSTGPEYYYTSAFNCCVADEKREPAVLLHARTHAHTHTHTQIHALQATQCRHIKRKKHKICLRLVCCIIFTVDCMFFLVK